MGDAEVPQGEEVGSRADALRDSYDRVAERYAEKLFDELAYKPLDRALLASFAEQVGDLGPVCDMGCGPGQIGRYLHELGLPVVGVDPSPGMVEVARRLTPGIAFQQGSMLALEVDDGTWGGIVAFYSIIHVPPEDLPTALRELHRVLRPNGLVLLAFHVGDEVLHADTMLDRAVSMDFYLFESSTLERELADAGFVVEARLERLPYTPLEYPTRRGYLLARKPDSTHPR